jgi:hypothetical protein
VSSERGCQFGSGTLQLTAPTTNVNGNLNVTGNILGTITPANPLNLYNSPNRLLLYCDSGNISQIRIAEAQGTSGTPAKRLIVWTGANSYVHSDGPDGKILILSGMDSINLQTPLLTQNGNALIGGVVNTPIYSGSAILQGNQYWQFNCRNPSLSNAYLTPKPTSTTPLPGGLYFVSSTSFSYQNETRSVGALLSFTGGANGTCAGFFINSSPRSVVDDWSYIEGRIDGSFYFVFHTGGGQVAFNVTITRAC